MAPLEEAIGYKFVNSLLLAEAMTHPSMAYETQKPHFDNQRLEFLGDAVLQLTVTEWLYQQFPGFSEGEMTKLRARLVSGAALARFAKEIGLGQYLMMGKGEEASGGRARTSTLADAFESLTGAIYIDGGFDEAKKVLLNVCSRQLEHIANEPAEVNPKGQLQEQLQAIAPQSPIYQVVGESGKDHCKVFEVEVCWLEKVLGKGVGKSKKDAEISAAKAALEAKSWA
ncbi:ribonuclease III [Persicirhabdus sediminis]|uniref:Ribonuclease 3 n=1 Tax=Persicirhabdus sediminis TaxID=454144 RepID=A0A8J7SJ14_9BACT|nr:ribonuclease III [Persicirhabdus sediminis]MBK1791024.1 ribonuclease III [Persicirhabdus sediminis]